MSRGTSGKADIEAIAHLCEKICVLWGSQEFDAFVSRLIMDSRDGTRQGLPIKVAAELLFAAQINRTRRAIDLAIQLEITEEAAHELIEKGDTERLQMDIWDSPLSNTGREKVEHRQANRRQLPDRRHAQNTLFGYAFQAATSRYTLYAVIALLTAKAFWADVQRFLHALGGL